MTALAPAPALLQRFGAPGSRYAAYPARNRYVAAFGAEDCRRALRQRGSDTGVGGRSPLAIRIHVPFCASQCSFCSCPTVVTRRHGRGSHYVEALEHEIELAASAMGTRQVVSRVHVGGGTPLFLSDEELARIDTALRAAFRFAGNVDLSIEIDTRVAARERLAHLRTLGFSRISLPLQGFDARVQDAVHCVRPLRGVVDVVEAARGLGFASVHAGLLFGLPQETPASFARTLRELVELRADRVSLTPYEHAPASHRAQRMIRHAELPGAGARLAMQALGIDGLLGAGYVHIGMNEFALPGDPLVTAKRQGRLHRDLQGFGTRPDGDVLALGAFAAGRIGACHYQNALGLGIYFDALNQGDLPVARGLQLTRDDLARRAVIMAIVCQGRVDVESIDLSHLIDMRRVFARELAELEPLVQGGLVEMDDEGFQLTPAGGWFARNVAMVFDREAQRLERGIRLSCGA